MLKKHLFTTVPGAALLLACSFACAQDDSSKAIAAATTSVKEAPKQEKTVPTAVPVEKKTQPSTDSISNDEIIKVSEAFGHFIGRNLKTPGITFDLESIIKGMRDGYSGKTAPMNDKEYEELMAKVQERAYNQLSANNLKAANDFLAENAKVAGVIEIEPGKLQYKLIKEGTGPVVAEHGSPQIHYVGKFIDGTSFGNSAETGGPITIPLDQTISGFSKGIAGMKEGEKRVLYVHPELGYGTAGQLPPNSLLIFEVEVVKAVSPDTDNTSSQSDDDFSDLNDDDLSDDDVLEDAEDAQHATSVKPTAKSK